MIHFQMMHFPFQIQGDRKLIDIHWLLFRFTFCFADSQFLAFAVNMKNKIKIDDKHEIKHMRVLIMNMFHFISQNNQFQNWNNRMHSMEHSGRTASNSKCELSVIYLSVDRTKMPNWRLSVNAFSTCFHFHIRFDIVNTQCTYSPLFQKTRSK